MNAVEVARVLAKAAAFDRRTVGDADVMAWLEAIGDLDVDEALAGVTRWYRDRADWLMPAHLREAIVLNRTEAARRARLAAAEHAIAPPERPAGRSWGELGPDERQALSEASGGLLAAVVAERFGTAPVNPPSTLDVYGETRQVRDREGVG